MFPNERSSTTILGACKRRDVSHISDLTRNKLPPHSLFSSPSSLSFTPFLPWPKRRRRSASRFKLASLDARKCHVMMASIVHCIRCPLVRSSRPNVIGDPSAFSQRVARQPPAIYSVCDLLETNPFDPPSESRCRKKCAYSESINDSFQPLSSFPLCTFPFMRKCAEEIVPAFTAN